MSKTMSSLLVAIAQALDKEFDNITVETGEVPQDFEVPAFYITPLDYREKAEVNRRRRKESTFVITYFPQAAENALELADAAERLVRTLRIIDDDGVLTRAVDLEVVIQEGVAVATAEYHCHVRMIASERNLMEILDQRRRSHG